MFYIKKIYFFCILFLALKVEANFSLSICCIFKNEAPFLKEWIEFHKIQGVNHFYLYNNNSCDNYEEILHPYIQSEEVTLVNWPLTYQMGETRKWLSIQHSAYMDCVKRYGKETLWLAVLDADEFLFCPNGEPLVSFLNQYTQFAGVCANWLLFGTSNVHSIPEGELMIETLTRCSAPDYFRNIHVKSIVQPKYVIGCHSSHFFVFQEGYFSVDANRNIVKDRISSTIILDKIRINHYWTKTEHHFYEKKCPSRHLRRENENSSNLKQWADEYNSHEDFAILQFIPLLKERLWPK